ncbi:TraB/GumN family protein [Chelativorans salis]|uniref:TraB/GumN family protein n=1 Tax=Chelativorans salis TaxID=2978478 RepID=A0ABT2LR91_9HYPH|nr:TraB/GumN family protein [Chelativorans sp. EGI FJ00035]MCT7376604.1 TraB/GumN family protein [Chelativorans sp. EGI FJ00035]
MKRTRALADRIAVLSLNLVAAINLLFVLFFVAVLVLVSGRARAEETVCEGTDLVEALSERDPALLRKMREEAAATPNGEGLLWRVEGKGGAPSFLFGTMHMTDPRVVAMPEAARAAFAAAHTVAIETTDVLDQKAMMAALAETPELMMFPPGEALTDYLTAEEQERLREALDTYGVPLQSVVKLKPWMLLSLIAQSACEVERQEAGVLVLDGKLAKDAKAAGKRLVGLERASEQFSAIASLPMEMHIEGLISTIDLGEGVNDVTETMIGLYLNGEIGMVLPAITRLLPQGAQFAAGSAAFEEKLITARNRVMAERALPLIEEGRAFIAVGALHLPGETGLVALLREEGYTVSRAD